VPRERKPESRNECFYVVKLLLRKDALHPVLE